ncbi:Early nodulin-like protein 1 [Ananas comosus]|uniref:Early nodulin-like protein 1 n=1 Tax=Ananas comosus TaxID=4615 RepID=A0A199VTS2_ANACO|nr:Early nodulin-like protein 1 [Ananas comosus]
MRGVFEIQIPVWSGWALGSVLLFFLLLFVDGRCSAFQYKVGDLDAWGIPPPSKPDVYSLWSHAHHFQLGDSLLFLYPPSQDSVVQVTEKAFNSCSLLDPILKLSADGNSVFNLTAPGRFYFTSGVPGHCDNHQKLAVDVPSANGTSFFPPAQGPSPSASASAAPAAASPSYPLLFGPSAAQESAAPPAGGSAALAMGSVIAVALLFIV